MRTKTLSTMALTVVGACVATRASAQSPLPNLVVTEVRTVSASPRSADLAVEVEVCNLGAEFAPVEVSVVLSTDAVFDLADPVLDTVQASPLGPARCGWSTVNTTAPWSPGTYWFGAEVDRFGFVLEQDELDNSRLGGPVAVGDDPDYFVAAIDAPASADGPFTASVTVCNQGSWASQSFEVRLYASQDALLELPSQVPTSQDLLLGQATAYTPFGPCTIVEIPTGAPPPWPGAAFLGASVDEAGLVPELLETNNAAIGPVIGLGSGPDLIVHALEAPSTLSSAFDATVTVCNQGTAPSNATDVHLFGAASAAVDPLTDPQLGTAPVPGLVPGQCSALTIGAWPPPVPATEGFLGALIDPMNLVPELVEDNGLFVAGPFGLGAGPDLAVTEVDMPLNVDGNFTARITVCNQGSAPASPDGVRLIASADPQVDDPRVDWWTWDLEVGFAAVPSLAPDACTTLDTSAFAFGPSPSYFGARVDDGAGLRSSNDVFVRGPIGVGQGPDFVVRDIEFARGYSFGSDELAVEVCNEGTDVGGTVQVELLADPFGFFSTSMFLPNPLYLGWLQTSGSMGPGQCETLRTPAAYAPTGAFYLGAIVNGLPSPVFELREDNNLFTTGPVGLGQGPDLFVAGFELPPSAVGPFDVLVDVCNRGSAAVGASDVTLYASADETIESAVGSPWSLDFPIGNAPVPNLEAGACAFVPVSVIPPPVPWGAYYVGAFVDEYDTVSELIEPETPTVLGPMGFGGGPDLVVTELDAPPSSNGPFDVAVTVCNQGTDSASSTDLELYASEDQTITTGPSGPDHLAGFAALPALQAGQCDTVTVVAGPPAGPSGAWFLSAIVDPADAVPELVEARPDPVFGPFGFGAGANLVVAQVDLPPSVDGPFTAVATVCNRGTTSAPSVDVEVYGSLDEVVEPPTSNPYSPDLLLGAAPVAAPIDAGRCVDVPIAASPLGLTGAAYVAARVDPFDAVPELIEGDNLTLVGPVGFGPGVNLFVRDVTVVRDASAGQDLIDVEVCNDGTLPTGPTDVEVLASPYDRFLTRIPAHLAPDVSHAAYLQASSLAAGQCERQQLPVSGLPWSAVYLGAIADPWRSTPELREDDNLAVFGPVGLGPQPDLRISEIVLPPSANGPFEVIVEVCNDTSVGHAPATGLSLYASTDPDVQVPPAAPWSTDLFIGSGPIDPLAPTQCQRIGVQAYASQPFSGPFWIGAWVDDGDSVSESLESNNLTVAGPMGLGAGPDLVVGGLDLPPTVVGSANGAVTVCNQGTEFAPATIVELYASADQAIDPGPGGDFFTGAAGTPSLFPGQCAAVPVQVSAPPVGPGASYFGAIVDGPDAVWELREDNQTAVFGPYGVGSGPNLVVSQLSLPPTADTRLDVEVTVCNVGDQPSGSTQVVTFASTDEEIERPVDVPWTTDLPLGAVALGALQAGECTELTVSGPSAPPPGAYYVGAFVDEPDAVFELIESDNLTVGGPVGVGFGPNYVVRALDVRPTPFPAPPGTAELEVEVCNNGTAPGGSVWVDVFASPDGHLTALSFPPPPALQFLDAFSSSPLAAGACETVLRPSVSLPWPEGAWYVAAEVDVVDAEVELREDDNLTVIGPVGLGLGPNLAVDSITLPAAAEGTFAASARVCNVGFAPATSSQVTLFASEDDTFEHPAQAPWSTDLPIGTAPVGPLEPGLCEDVAVSAFAPPLPSGAYFVAAAADDGDVVLELLESDNARVEGPIGFGFGPVLVVSDLAAAPVQAGSLDATVTVCNVGTDFAPGADVALFVSADANFDIGPFGLPPVAGQSTPPLAAGACAAVSITGAPLPLPDGAYYLGAVADFADSVSELVEDPTPAVFGPFGFGFGPDLVVSQVSLPPSSLGAFTAQVQVCNQGTAPSPASDVELYASTDAVLDLVGAPSGDLPIGGAPVPALLEGQCAAVSVPATSPAQPGAWYVAARVDPYDATPELLEGNNTAWSGPIGFGSGPDLVIRDAQLPPVLFGWNQTGAVTVCNDGTTPSPSTSLELFATRAPTPEITAPFSPNGVVPVGFGTVNGLAASACEVVSIPLSEAFLGGAVHVTATIDLLDSVAELVETNNQRVFGPIGDGPGIELRVESVSGPAFAAPGQEIVATARVCNDGAIASGGTALRLFASADGQLDTRGLDPEVGSGPVPAIAGLGCVDVVVPTLGFASLAEGVWRLGAEVDPFDLEAELVESNNATLGGAVQIAAAFCGNGALDPGEACDDGNFTSGDGCSAACVVEFCGDGIVNLAEICDDGNSLPYDGCSPTCVPQGALLGEVIQISANQSGQGQSWYPLSFDTGLVSPVVVAHTLSFNGGDPTHLRVRNVNGAGFEWKMEEWAYKDGNHTTETLPFLAVEAGRHTLDGGEAIEAGTISAGSGWVTVTFSAPFGSTPALLTGVMSDADSTPVVVRTRNLTANGFEVRVQEEEAEDGTHPAETVAFVALEPGVGFAAGATFEAGRTPDAVQHPWYGLSFSASFGTAPVLLANMDTFDGADTAGVRYRNLGPSGAQVKIEEEQSRDSETNHTTERVSWLVWEAPGPIVAAP